VKRRKRFRALYGSGNTKVMSIRGIFDDDVKTVKIEKIRRKEDTVAVLFRIVERKEAWQNNSEG
jgi:hypothetical protein